jgi:hypothetical protein
MGRDPKCRAQQGLSRSSAEQDDRLRSECLDLGDEPGPAGDDLTATRLLVYPAFAALAGELEVFDGVGLIRQPRIDVGVAERTRQQPSGRPDKRQPLDVLAVAGLLTHQHDRRIRMTMPENRLRGVLVERAPATAARGGCQGIQSTVLGQELLRSARLGRAHAAGIPVGPGRKRSVRPCNATGCCDEVNRNTATAARRTSPRQANEELGGALDIVLGVSMAPSKIRMVLVEGENGDGVLVDEDHFDVVGGRGPASLSAPDQVIAAILGTREGAIQAGHQLRSTGVTWTDPRDAAALATTLAARKVENVMLVSAFLSAAALAQTVGNAIGYIHTAMLFVEPDSATLALVDSHDGSITDVQRKPLRSADRAHELATLIAGLDAPGTSLEGLFLVGCGVDIVPIKPVLERASRLPISAPEEPATALARGAALASANAPLFASSTVALAYAQDPGTGEVDRYAVSPGYLSVPARHAGAVLREEDLAYSAAPDDEADAHTGVVKVDPERDVDASQPRRPLVLVGSALAVLVVSAALALEIALALGIRPAVALRPTPGQALITPVQAAAPPAPQLVRAPQPQAIHLPVRAAPPAPPLHLPAAAPIAPVPVPAAPVPVPVPVPVPMHAGIPAPSLHAPSLHPPMNLIRPEVPWQHMPFTHGPSMHGLVPQMRGPGTPFGGPNFQPPTRFPGPEGPRFPMGPGPESPRFPMGPSFSGPRLPMGPSFSGPRLPMGPGIGQAPMAPRMPAPMMPALPHFNIPIPGFRF